MAERRPIFFAEQHGQRCARVRQLYSSWWSRGSMRCIAMRTYRIEGHDKVQHRGRARWGWRATACGEHGQPLHAPCKSTPPRSFWSMDGCEHAESLPPMLNNTCRRDAYSDRRCVAGASVLSELSGQRLLESAPVGVCRRLSTAARARL